MLAFWLRPFAMIVRLPRQALAICVMLVSLIGIYTVNTRLFDCGVALAAGLLGYILLRFRWPVVALVMGLVIGPIVEDRLRQTLSLGEGSLWILFERPLTLALLLCSLVLIGWTIWRREREEGSL
jgi:putative tricarboxylic transport membrane protein